MAPGRSKLQPNYGESDQRRPPAVRSFIFLSCSLLFSLLLPHTLRTIASLPRRNADSRIRICGGRLSGYTLRSINRIGGPGFPGRWSRRRS